MSTHSNPLIPDTAIEYLAVRSTWASLDLGQRTQLELRGADRQAFLHNLCTNHIKRLAPGEGCEAFVTNVQGKVLGHILVFSGNDSLIVDTVPGQADTLLAHLERYHIREKVELIDRSDEWAELLVVGPQAKSRLEERLGETLSDRPGTHARREWDGLSGWVRTTDLAGPASFLICVRRQELEALRTRLAEAGAVACSQETWETIRLETGTPCYGTDISLDNLPQEVNRNEQAINFNKGCYLGQETVARLDALGHVNRLLVGLKLPTSTAIAVGQEIESAGKKIARITSVGYSPRLGAPFALAYVRREHAEPGSRFPCPGGEAEVVALPLA